MFDHMEIALHDFYGTKEYWKARRSMRYNSELYDIANEFRKSFFNSSNKYDKTERPDDWTKEKVFNFAYIIRRYKLKNNFLIIE